MAEEKKSHEYENKVGQEEGSVETKDRGLFDFIGKKKEEKKPQQQQVINTTDYDQKVKISDAEENKSGLLEKIIHGEGHSSSSSPNDYEKEGVEGEERNKEKKGVTEQIKEKISGDDKKDTSNVAIEKLQSDPQDEKKGLLEKVEENLPAGQHKKSEEEHHVTNAPPPVVTHYEQSEDANEKKGLLDKIKEKLPGYHSKTEDENEKVKETGH